MRVASVERLRRPAKHYLIRLDHEIEFTVHEDTLIHFRLLKGAELTPEEYKQILYYEQSTKAYQAALRYISRRPHSTGEISRKLREQGYEPEFIASVIERLIEQNYLNDQEFAHIWARERVHNGKKGRGFVQHELKQKGLSSKHIAEALLYIDEEAELDSAYTLLCKRAPYTKGEPMIQRHKLMQYLQRKGFTHSTIRQAFQRWKDEQDNSS